MKHTKLWIGFALVIGAAFVAESALAYTFPQPKSGGKYFRGKGTKAGEDYDGLAASRPFYEYGKGLEVGVVDLKPFGEYNLRWDDNINLEPSNEDEDLIHRARAGATAEIPLEGGKHVLYGTGIYDGEYFTDFDEENHDDFIVQAGADLNFVPFRIAVDDTFKQTSNREDTELTRRIERDENVFDALIEIPFASFFVETEFIDNWVQFNEEFTQFDRNEAAIFPRVGIDVGPRTQLLGEYGYTNIDYDNLDTRDGDAHEGSVGLRGNLTERAVYQLWVGYQDRQYDLDSRSDYGDVIARGTLQYDLTPASQIFLTGQRRPQESTFSDESFYVNNALEARWRQQVADRWYVNSRGNIHFNEYEGAGGIAGESEREDTVWGAGAGLEYLMPNDIVSFLLEYRFRSRDSNIDRFDYDSNGVTAGVRATF